jgi:hypothetical protein
MIMTVPDGYNIQPTGPMIGADDANNEFASSNVVPNADGSALERLEYIQTQIAAEAVKTTALQADTVNIPNVASKVLATIANGSTTLFNYTGTVKINSIVGRVTTVCEAKGTNYKLSVVSDALGAVDICADLDLTAAVVGTLLSITRNLRTSSAFLLFLFIAMPCTFV